ncbi:FAD/NAD(P)-binding domain-containing protein [Rhizodiscina lignyota]|uniref:FAD/NAD(P)-binding domain-containing protein n=1 Tax=Rhizodiscina lignyota TaxID=1504668 RepID=A0A9P4IEJ6_9PEZI|nr:FAD/NAD(P)-binding domain-containing protein [Rhizodiscina lignyota]
MVGPLETYDVVVVGGGFCGCYSLHQLRENGFSAHLFEAGTGLGGIWHWNCYPGARVDTEVPCYQLTSPETWETYRWRQRFPGRDELKDYFRHLDRVWDLSRDISYSSRVTAMEWNDAAHQWHLQVNNGESYCTARHVLLCTGFASKPYFPPIKNADVFKGETYHTSLWPQNGVKLDGRRVAIIGTGASGVQCIQEVGYVASQMTVFQRTPNTALPMENPDVTDSRREELRQQWPEIKKQMDLTFAGFDYEFVSKKAAETTKEERMAMYEKLFHTGGLHFWLGTYKDVLFDQDLNDEAYAFWRAKTLKRIKNKRAAEILAPEIPPHPFGTKRISLEQGFFEHFNKPNVDIVNLRENPISELVPQGIRTADGVIREFDVIIYATGFDSITGGITQMNIRGASGQYVKAKWDHGVYTYLGMTTSDFPNLYFTYGPQAPTAFATGPSSAENQGGWVIECLKYMRQQGYTRIEATRPAEENWREHVNEVANDGLFPKAESWYFGANIPGKPREALNYMNGWPEYRKWIWDNCAKKGYKGFTLSKLKDSQPVTASL